MCCCRKYTPNRPQSSLSSPTEHPPSLPVERHIRSQTPRIPGNIDADRRASRVRQRAGIDSRRNGPTPASEPMFPPNAGFETWDNRRRHWRIDDRRSRIFRRAGALEGVLSAFATYRRCVSGRRRHCIDSYVGVEDTLRGGARVLPAEHGRQQRPRGRSMPASLCYTPSARRPSHPDEFAARHGRTSGEPSDHTQRRWVPLGRRRPRCDCVILDTSIRSLTIISTPDVGRSSTVGSRRHRLGYDGGTVPPGSSLVVDSRVGIDVSPDKVKTCPLTRHRSDPRPRE